MPKLFIRVISEAMPVADSFQMGVEWLILEDDGSRRASGVTDFRGLNDLIDPSVEWLQQPRNIVVILTSENVLCVTCQVPGRNMGQVKKALPFVVEEFITSDIEQMHIAHGVLNRGAPIRCNLVALEQFNNWLAAFDSAGLQPGFLISEAELLPSGDHLACALFDGDQVLVKVGDEAATVDRDNLPFALGEFEEGTLLQIHGTLSEQERQELPSGIEIDNSSSVAGSANTTTLSYLAERWRQEDVQAINLLQGDFTPVVRGSADASRWRSVAVLACIFFGIGLLSMVVKGLWAGQQADQLEAQSRVAFLEIFPQETKVTNVRRALRNHLGGSAGDGGKSFNGMVSDISAVLNPAVKLQGMNFTQGRGELVLDVVVATYDALDSVKETLEKASMKVEITSAEQQDNGVRARLKLGGRS